MSRGPAALKRVSAQLRNAGAQRAGAHLLLLGRRCGAQLLRPEARVAQLLVGRRQLALEHLDLGQAALGKVQSEGSDHIPAVGCGWAAM